MIPPKKSTAIIHGNGSLSDGVLTYLTMMIISHKKKDKHLLRFTSLMNFRKKTSHFGKQKGHCAPKIPKQGFFVAFFVDPFDMTITWSISINSLNWNCQQFPIAPSSPCRHFMQHLIVEVFASVFGKPKNRGALEPLETMIWVKFWPVHVLTI